MRLEAGTIPPQSGPTAPFSEEFLRDEGLEGFLRVIDLVAGPSPVPAGPGVYAVVRRSNAPPQFLPASVGGHFKGKDPSVTTANLEEKWVEGAASLYVGRASNLRQRLHLLARFADGQPVAHWGGRYLWQLADHDDLLVAWQETGDQIAREAELTREFIDVFDALPFANLVQPRAAG